jgi:hypothetical protein
MAAAVMAVTEAGVMVAAPPKFAITATEKVTSRTRVRTRLTWVRLRVATAVTVGAATVVTAVTAAVVTVVTAAAVTVVGKRDWMETYDLVLNM